MKTSKRGFLKEHNDTWSFHVGRNKQTITPFPIPALNTNISVMIADGKIASGWKATKHMIALHTLHDLETVMLRRMSFMNSTDYPDLSSSSIRQYIALNPPQTFVNGKRAHIDASPLTSNTSPSSLKYHHRMNTTDKSIWECAYLNEYLGLTEDTNTWQYITECEYQLLRPITGNALPSMAISTIK